MNDAKDSTNVLSILTDTLSESQTRGKFLYFRTFTTSESNLERHLNENVGKVIDSKLVEKLESDGFFYIKDLFKKVCNHYKHLLK